MLTTTRPIVALTNLFANSLVNKEERSRRHLRKATRDHTSANADVYACTIHGTNASFSALYDVETTDFTHSRETIYISTIVGILRQA